MNIQATYSVENNKLRLYAPDRLDADLYERVRAAGFKWAPKQALFVAPGWTPSREDVCIELARDISAEQTTLVERADAKAERLRQSNAFHEAANRILQRFAADLPIQIGHHSERKARKDQERITANMDKAVKSRHAVTYWASRATGIEHHANRTAAPAVRARRIKTLLKELRYRLRHVDHRHICRLTLNFVGLMIKSGSKPVNRFRTT